jgi:hypothetical protein
MEQEFGLAPELSGAERHRKMVRQELDFLGKRRKIIGVMLMEALKNEDSEPFLFQCAEMVFKEHLEIKVAGLSREKQRILVHEFFTGFVPLVVFAALQEKWARYFGCDPDAVKKDFWDSFSRTHLQNG